MLKLHTLDEITELTGKTVLLRADLDVPISQGQVTDNFRLTKAVNTIKCLVEHRAKVVVIGHLGRPEGKYVDELSLLPVRFELGKLLGMHIKFAHIPSSRNSIRYMENGEVLMLENVRFNPEEESDDKKARNKFVAELAELGDYYVNDAFSAYRPHASNYELAKKFKPAYAGLQIQAEVENLAKLAGEVEHPYVAVIGGAKIDTKIDVLLKLVKQADYILIGGAMAYTFLKSQGVNVGGSKCEDDKLDVAKQVLKAAEKSGCKIMLPEDHIVADKFDKDAKPEIVDNQEIPESSLALDIGPKTTAKYVEIIKSAKTILWNGPMGVSEWPNFAKGTKAIGEAITLGTPREVFKVAGGGDTTAAIATLKINLKYFTHVSTGGGAMLAFLAGEKMPTLQVLEK